MKDFVIFFNNALTNIKAMIEILYSNIKIQYLRQMSKSFASAMELKNVFKKRDDNADDFQDFDRIENTTDLILDKEGFTLKYNIEEKYFKKVLYTQENYPMIMSGSHIIPGSSFKEIFNNGIGFWGYISEQKTQTYFTIDFEKQEIINKVHLETNNLMNVTLYIKEDFNGEFLPISDCYTRYHMWNFSPRKCISLKFESDTDVFSVTRLQAGLARYQKYGVFESIYYKIKDLYRLKVDIDKDIPQNTNIDFFIDASGQLESYPLSEDTVISGGIEWKTVYGSPSVSGILPSGYIDDSLTVKMGYNEWDIIETEDLVWTIIPADKIEVSGILNSNNSLTINSDYTLMEGSLQKVFLGSTLFEQDLDYSVDYNLDGNIIIIKRLERSNIPTAEFINLTYTILGRIKEPINQIRTYVTLDYEQDIIIQGFEVPFRIRQVVIKDDIVRDITQDITLANASIILEDVNNISSYIVNGQPGVNLIEIESYDSITGLTQIPDPMNINIVNIVHFAKKYNLIENSLTPDMYEYRLDAEIDASGSITSYQIVPGASGDIWTNYAVSTENDSYIKLRAILTSIDGNNTPTLRSYNISNFTK